MSTPISAPVHTPPSNRRDEPRGMPAIWRTSHPTVWGLALSVGGLILTAVGAGFAAQRRLGDEATIWTLTGFVAVSALVGLTVMARSRPGLAAYGWRAPIGMRRIGFGLPLLIAPIAVATTSDFEVTRATALAYLVLTVCVGINEEVWFRGLVLAALRGLGDRRAVVTGACLFGALHLANAGSGKSGLYLLLQAVFAAEVGVVLGALVALTRSLWIGVAWHLVYDLTAYCTGDRLDGRALAGVIVMMIVLAGYATWLLPKVPR